MRTLTLCAAIALLLTGCGKQYDYPFQNPNLSFEQRAADLVSRLTLEEKAAQMLNQTPAIERLGIPPYDWWNECLHGVARTKYKVTVFPQAIAMAAGWDTEAILQMADYTAAEGRAIYNTAAAKGDYSRYHGLTYWTPNINIVRDPRWGRGHETYGEDPLLTAAMGENFVRGLQGADPRYLKAAACAKHYAVHSGPEALRHKFNVNVSPYDLWDTYLPAFQRLVVDAKVAGVMCAYNAFEGQPCCANDKLMNQILRQQWGFTGYVTSDCGAIDDFYREWGHKSHNGAPTAAADALIHGTDVDCGNHAYNHLIQAVQEGLIPETQIDTSLVRLFTIRMRLGMFDPKEIVPFAAIDSTTLEAPAHKELSLKMARQSIVLLKNDKHLLPLNNSVKRIAVIGPNACNPEAQLGNYNGFPTKIISVLEGISDAMTANGGEVLINPAVSKQVQEAGITLSNIKTSYLSTTPKDCGKTNDIACADAIVYVGGLNPSMEGEDGDGGERQSIMLLAQQVADIKELKKTGKPIILVLMTGSAIALPSDIADVPAVVNAWYGGEFAGRAVADVLFGKYNPSGRLPVTFYAADSDLPPFEDYAMSNRTYKYFKGQPLYPFGWGLSFTEYKYAWDALPQASYSAKDVIKCRIAITNTGSMDGDEVAQVYIKYPQGGAISLPIKELRHFQRTSIPAGQTAKVDVAIPVEQLAKWDEAVGGFAVPQGEYAIYAGGHSGSEAVGQGFVVK
jgi:beta-glucosidase